MSHSIQSGYSGLPVYRATELARLLGLAVLYALLATLVLRLFAANGIVSIVWPASGVALAALLLGGNKYAPGIWLGAWVANLLAGSAPFAAAVIALGNTLEALFAVWLLSRSADFDPLLRNLRDLLRLILLGAFAASLVSALTGSTTLLLSGVIGAAEWPGNLAHWWMGDALGIVLVTPLLLVWQRAPDWRAQGRLGEAALLLGVSFLAGQVIFLGWFEALFAPFARGYWMFLLITLVAARLGTHGVLALLLMTAVQALWGTYLNTGFFAGDLMLAQLTIYWGHMLVLTIVGMALALYIDGMKRVEATLLKGEEQLNRAQAVAKIGSWALDVRSNILTWTPENYRIFGVAPGVPLSYETFLDCVHPDDRAYVHTQWSAALRGEPYDIEHRVVARGEVRWVNERANLSFTPDGQLIGGVGVTQDITERKRFEERLTQLSLAVEQSPNAIVITNNQAEIEFVNAAFSAATGYTLDEVKGRNPRLLASRQTPTETFAELWQALKAGETWRGELVNRRKNGEVFVTREIISPIRQSDGCISHYLSIFEDITDWKRIAEELEHYRHHLEERVAERTAELVTARNEAERLTAVKSEFLANMSHEIRTPLNAIQGLARIGSRDSVGRESRDTFSRIQDAGAHLLGVINDILDFSRLDAGKLAVESRPFALGAALSNAGSFVAGAAKQKGLVFEVTCAPELPAWVNGDAQRLQQILINLLANAVKFTDHGEVRLRVARDGEDCYFKVIDSGIGMTPAQVGQLFQPFEQADSSTTRKYGGSGLGLAISQNLARLMGGDITVDSAPGAGSAFTLRLPLPAATPEVSALADRVAGEKRLAGLHLLAAEDVEVNQLILEDMLVHEGAHVLFAGNGQQAIERLEEAGVSAFDAVLMDVQMPLMDGLEATRHIRTLAPGLPVIGLTAHALAEERERCRAAGMVEHVTKPIDPDELVAAILRCTGGVSSHAAHPLPRQAQLKAGGESINWAALLARYGNRQAFVARLARTVMESQRDAPARLRAAAQARDMKTLVFLAHTIKGVAGNLMAREVQALAARTDAAARQHDTQAARLADDLADAMEALCGTLAAHLEILDGKSGVLGETADTE